MRTLRSVLSALVTALALATAAGLLLDPLRPGSAVHVHWLGDGFLRGILAAAFCTAVLVRLPSRLSLAVLLATALVAGAGAGRHLAAVAQGRVSDDGTFPNACLLAAVLLSAWIATGRPRCGGRSFLVRAGAVGVASLVLALGWIGAAGAIDYGVHASADAILVFGSRVHADGRPSGSLLDRTVTACDLWFRGAAPVLVLSGGRAPDAPLSEPEAMRRIALDRGVAESALVLDEEGATTADTVRNLADLAHERGWGRVLAVSHDYHLARIRLLFDRAGLPVATVPARETCPGWWKLTATGREVLAWTAAWLMASAPRTHPS